MFTCSENRALRVECVLFLKKKNDALVDTVPTNGYWPASVGGAESKYYKILGGWGGTKMSQRKGVPG